LGKLNGYKINEFMSISAIAYADDIHPISDNAQDMPDIIDQFLKSHNMKLNADKSKILTNNDGSNYNFIINEQSIKIIPKN
jgi:hypothetical protein